MINSQVLKKCHFCKKEYFVKKSRFEKSKYCSNTCKSDMQKIILLGRKMPEGCIKEASGKSCRLGFGKICGHLTAKGRNYCAACRDNMMGKVTITCRCGKQFYAYKSAAEKYKSCSMACRNNSMRLRQSGDKSHFWRGGITDLNQKIRNSAQSKEWRTAVFTRDGYKCVSCGQNGGKLCADHIKSFSLYPALRFDLFNGRTLCYPCHQKTENFGYRAIVEAERLKNKMGQTQLMLI
jgi:hypothetical protein